MQTHTCTGTDKRNTEKRDKYARGWVHSVASVGMTITFSTASSSRPRAKDFLIASAYIWVGQFPHNNDHTTQTDINK